MAPKRKPDRGPRRPGNNAPEWEVRFGLHDRFNRALAPAYNKAVAPIIAGAMHEMGKQSISVLVVGGGKGRFTRDTLPAVRALLAERRFFPEIDVVETDAVRLKGVHVVASVDALPFPDGHFDFIIGQSMVHQGRGGKMPDMTARYREIGRVMREGGAFIHIADSVPATTCRGRPVINSAEKPVNDLRGTHKALCYLQRDAARKNGLSFATRLQSGSAEIPRGNIAAVLKELGLSRDANTLDNAIGIVRTGRKPEVPKGRVAISYTGLVTIAAKKSVSDTLNHIHNEGFSNLG